MHVVILLIVHLAIFGTAFSLIQAASWLTARRSRLRSNPHWNAPRRLDSPAPLAGSHAHLAIGRTKRLARAADAQ